jgi:hypothetical protein
LFPGGGGTQTWQVFVPKKGGVRFVVARVCQPGGHPRAQGQTHKQKPIAVLKQAYGRTGPMRRECSRQRLLLLAALLAALAHAVPHDRERRQRDKLLRGAGVIEVETTQMMDDTAPREVRPAARGRDSPNNRALVPRVNATEAAAPTEPTEPTQNDACRGKNQGADCSDALVADGFCNVIPMGRGVLTMCQQKGPVSARYTQRPLSS